MTDDRQKASDGGELKPCFHEGEEKEYVVCDRCIRKWNTEVSGLRQELAKRDEANKRLMDALAEANERVNKAMEALDDYGQHTDRCIRSFWHAGEPTANGGYREKFGDKWYQSRPIDETPKCNCGFGEALSLINAERGKG